MPSSIVELVVPVHLIADVERNERCHARRLRFGQERPTCNFERRQLLVGKLFGSLVAIFGLFY